MDGRTSVILDFSQLFESDRKTQRGLPLVLLVHSQEMGECHMTLSNEYYFIFEIHTLFEPDDHPETGDYSTVFIAAMFV